MTIFERIENLFAAAGMAEGGDAETAARMAGEGDTRFGVSDGRSRLTSPLRA